MEKIWVVYKKVRYGNRAPQIFKSEADMLRKIHNTQNWTIYEYDLRSTQTAADFLKAKERDTQVRSVLGELEVWEENALKLVEMYDSLVPVNPADRHSTRESTIAEMKRLVGDKKAFCNYLINKKKHFFKVSHSVEWLVAILRCHNFRDPHCSTSRFDQATRTWKRHNEINQQTIDNFALAKAELKKKK
jgi:hypothetical protein